MNKLAAESDENRSAAAPPAATQSPIDDGPQPRSAAQPAPPAPSLDASKAVCNYSNFCRVIGTPEEVLLDLGLNENPTVAPAAPVAVTQRVVMNYYTAKRLLHALQLTVERHETVFGAIEVDVQRRLMPQRRQ